MVESKKKPNLGLAIGGLIINILILPGLGTIIAGETKTGIIQLVLFLIGLWSVQSTYLNGVNSKEGRN